MASKQYGLKIVHKPSNIVEREQWFNTAQERNTAMAGSTMERDYIYVWRRRKLRYLRISSPESGAVPPNGICMQNDDSGPRRDEPLRHVVRCLTLQDAFDHCDAHREHVWEHSNAPNVLLVSCGFKEGSVMWRMTRYTVVELAAHRVGAENSGQHGRAHCGTDKSVPARR
jgi:hypothetical protein